MPLQVPNLDDRSFRDLLASALSMVERDLNAEWTDLSPGDPGIVLLEAFAYLTEQMLYRLNQLPEKAYIAFLRLLGVSLYPPTAASVTVRLQSPDDATRVTHIPMGTQLTVSGGSQQDTPLVFITADFLDLAPGETQTVTAYHCEQIQAELVGLGTGVPGLTMQVARPPIVSPMTNRLDLAVGVEIDASDQTPNDRTAENGKVFRIWQEVPNFANLSERENQQVYVVDRQSGLIQFAPAARLSIPQDGVGRVLSTENRPLAAVPLPGREIRVWYPRGGGSGGNNVPPGSLNSFVDPAYSQITVTNLGRSQLGVDGETLANALMRGPKEVYALDRAVTADDFERVALQHIREGVARAKAYALARLWRYGIPGTVEISLVPAIPKALPTAVTAESLAAHQVDDALSSLLDKLEAKKPLGTRVRLRWTKYKQVQVQASLKLGGSEDHRIVEQRILERLHRFLSPLSFEDSQAESATSDRDRLYRSGWPFGQSLYVADIYRLLLATEPGIALISSLEIQVTHAPDRDIHCLTADRLQPRTWYCGSGTRFFRSTNNGDGWELLQTFAPGQQVFIKNKRTRTWEPGPLAEDQTVCLIEPCPDFPGLVALSTGYGDAQSEKRSPLYLSPDCGETWFSIISDMDRDIHDMAWLLRGNQPLLLLATSKGLLEVEISLEDQQPSAQEEAFKWAQIPVTSNPAAPLYSVVTLRGQRGNARVAVALQHRQGVYLSYGSDLYSLAPGSEDETAVPDTPSAPTSFTLIGGKGEDIRHLNVQTQNQKLFLWAGLMARADKGRGCLRWQTTTMRLNMTQADMERVDDGWTGGSCYALAFQRDRVFAVTAWGGVLQLENRENETRWLSPEREDLPLRQYQLALRHQLDDEHGSHVAAHEAGNGDLHPFLPLVAVATNDETPEQDAAIVMVGGELGIERSLDNGAHYEHASHSVFKQLKDRVTLPENWLLVSGQHAITIEQSAAVMAGRE